MMGPRSDPAMASPPIVRLAISPPDERQPSSRSCRHRASKEGPVDLPTIMALVVAMLILISGYFLFNDLPNVGRRKRDGRPPRRS